MPKCVSLVEGAHFVTLSMKSYSSGAETTISRLLAEVIYAQSTKTYTGKKLKVHTTIKFLQSVFLSPLTWSLKELSEAQSWYKEYTFRNYFVTSINTLSDTKF